MEKTLGFEGGVADNQNDPGGITNFGISLRSHPDLGADGIRNLTRDQAIALYWSDPWKRYGYDRFAPLVGAKLFDMAVNIGAPEAHRLFQRAICACGLRIADDGVLGPRTEGSANMLSPTMLLACMRAALVQFYNDLAAARPADATFLNGWIDRALS